MVCAASHPINFRAVVGSGLVPAVLLLPEGSVTGSLILEIFCLIALLGVYSVMVALERRYEAQGFSWRHSSQSTMLLLFILSTAALVLVGLRMVVSW